MVVLPEENIIRILTQSRVKSGSDKATAYKNFYYGGLNYLGFFLGRNWCINYFPLVN